MRVAFLHCCRKIHRISDRKCWYRGFSATTCGLIATIKRQTSTTEMRQNRCYRAAKSSLVALGYSVMILLAISCLQKTELSSRTASVPVESSNASFYYYVDEEVVEGSVIADLSVDFIRVYHVDEAERQRLTFLMFDQSITDDEAAAKLFDVDQQTGVLTTTMMPGRRLDREDLCDGSRDECVLSFDVVVQPSFEVVKVKVEVLGQGH